MKHWKFHIEDRIGFLTLVTDKPGNRLTPDTFAELNQVLEQLDVTSCGGLILQGEGDHFSQGFDLEFMLSSNSEDLAWLQDIFTTCNEALDRLYNLSIPSVALVKGSCIGGGLLIALATDFRVVDDNAKLGFPEIRQSLVVNLGLKRVYQLLGEARTKELVLLGNTVSAKTMYEWGAINWIVTDGQFDEKVQFFKEYVNSIPPLALKANKKLIHNLPNLSLKESISLENELQLNVLQSADFKEAITSFLQKRPPVFRGE